MLRPPIRPLPPPPHTRLRNPPHHAQENQPRPHPRQHHELPPLDRLHAHLVTLLINHIPALLNHRRNQRARQRQRQKRQDPHQQIHARRQPPRSEHGRHGAHERDEEQRDGDAVQHKGRHADDAQRVQARLDILGPVEVLQRDVDAGLVQRGLEDRGGVEGEARFGGGAPRDVLLDVGLGDGRVGGFEGRVLPVAVVEEVGRVEVLMRAINITYSFGIAKGGKGGRTSIPSLSATASAASPALFWMLSGRWSQRDPRMPSDWPRVPSTRPSPSRETLSVRME